MEKRRPLKVFMLTSSYPRGREDSAGVFLRYLAENLSQRGLEVHVLAPAYRKGGTCIEGNVHVHRFQYLPARLQKLAYGSGILPNLRHNPWLWIEVPFFLATMTYAFVRCLWREKPDLIHAHWVLPQGLVAVFAKLFYGNPVVITAHGSDAFRLKGRLTNKLKRLVLGNADAWTSNTRATSEALESDMALPKPRIIPMGVDVECFHSGERTSLRRELPENEFLILFVGRLVEEKGLRDLLSALTLLPTKLRRKASLWVLGDGPYQIELQQYAETLGMSGKVRFWGSISNHLLPDFYAAADLFVAPSGDSEGLGVVLLEAFAARLCVIATRVGGISEVVEDGCTGILVEPRNPQQLAITMEKLLSNERLRAEMAENAFARVKRYYDWMKIASDFEELYRGLIQKESNVKSHNIDV